MENIYWTGVGSRIISDFHANMLYVLGERFAKNGFILRSGKADGADTYCQLGAQSGEGNMEIYVPWSGFATESVTLSSEFDITPNMSDDSLINAAWEIVQAVHPAPNKLSQAARKLHTRNVFQVLGKDLNTPSKFLVACSEPTTNGVKGGTNTAWQIAKIYGIPCFNIHPISNNNLFDEDSVYDEIMNCIDIAA